ncbi:MAG TPA: PaaI family thioesterase [Acidimicrobiia bacterium]|nr:PaaI family thioesterase [Acidimicrobiia bacterium]
MEFHETDRAVVADMLRQASKVTLPGHMGLELIEIGESSARMRCQVRQFHLAPNGFLHAGSVITLADTAAGFGCVGNFPEGASGFTTIELKANFTGTLLEGSMLAEAQMIHGGRTTQVWDVEVSDEATERKLAYFRATQMILYPRD